MNYFSKFCGRKSIIRNPRSFGHISIQESVCSPVRGPLIFEPEFCTEKWTKWNPDRIQYHRYNSDRLFGPVRLSMYVPILL